MRKKILYVITKSTWGGAQQYVYDLATNLPKERFDVAVAAGNKGMLLDKLRAADLPTIIIPSLQRNVGFSSEFAAFRQLLKLFQTERPDIIHLNSSKAAALGAAAAFVFKLLNFFTFKPRVIFTVHGWGFNEDRPLIQRLAIFIASWLTCLFCDRVILINTADHRTARRFIPRRKLAFISHGLAPISFLSHKEARAGLSQAINRPIADDTILIGTIAELTRNKGLSYLISALSKFPHRTKNHYRGLASIVIGEGEERQDLQKYIDALSLCDAVHLPGFIPDAAQLLPAFDIFILPSIKEGLPYALMQAMAAGLPVIASRVGGIPDIVTEGVDGLLVPPKDPTALETNLLKLISSLELGQKLGTAAQQKIATKFPFRDMIARTISLYAQ